MKNFINDTRSSDSDFVLIGLKVKGSPESPDPHSCSLNWRSNTTHNPSLPWRKNLTPNNTSSETKVLTETSSDLFRTSVFFFFLTSLQTSMVPKTTCSPSKKLSPMRMTVAPPVVQPSLGLMALMQGVAASETRRHERHVSRGQQHRTHTNTHKHQQNYIRKQPTCKHQHCTQLEVQEKK